jgi:hypothetical protein
MRDEIEAIYAVELLFETRPKITRSALLSALREKCPDIEPMGEEEHQDFWAFAHPAHQVQYKDGAIPAQIVLFAGEREKDSVNIQDSLQQSWALPEAEEVVAAAPHSLLLTDLMAAGLPYKERVTLFLDSLEAIVRSLPCLAIHWRPSQQVTLATEFLKARDDAERHLLLSGPLNVRFFNVSNPQTPGESLADTMGLSILGLPDVQCHFHQLDVDQVVSLLYDVAIYLFENGDVIQDGHTVSGTEPGEKWLCQHENSLAPPGRVVLDINPGPKFAAGKRENPVSPTGEEG